MLSFTQKPTIVGESEGIVTKHCYLRGHEEAISFVARQRQADPSCQQLPHSEKVPVPYHVHVVYTVDTDRYVSVNSVSVSFDRGNLENWTCFYDASSRRVGEKTTCKGHFHFYFLDEFNHLDGISKLLMRFEERDVLKRLVKEGAYMIPDDDELEPLEKRVQEEAEELRHARGDEEEDQLSTVLERLTDEEAREQEV